MAAQQCPGGTVLTGVRHVDKIMTSSIVTTRGMTSQLGLYCSTVATDGSAITVQQTTPLATPALPGFAYSQPGTVENGYCPAGQVAHQMGGWDRDTTGFPWTSAVRLVCRPLQLNANSWVQVNTAAGGNVDAGVLEANAPQISRGPFCSAATANTMVSGYHRQAGGEGYDGINIYCGTLDQARFSSVLTFNNFAWNQTLGGSGWLTDLRQNAITLDDGGGNNGAGRTPHATLAANTNVFQAGREIYVLPGNNYNAQISQRPTGIAANTYAVTGNCIGTGIRLANQIDASCVLNVNGLPDISVGITTSPTYVAYGQAQNVTVTGVNLGPGGVQGTDGFSLITTLPTGWTATAVPGCTVAGQIVTCAITTALAAGSAPGIPGGSVSFTFPVTVNAPTANGSYPANVALGPSATNVDFNAANDAATGPLVLLLAAQPNFGSCDARMYLDQTNGPTTLSTLYNVGYASTPFTYAALGSSALVRNGIGYNPLDNFVYGIEWGGFSGNELVRIGADGSSVNLGPVTNLPLANYSAGAFSPAGDYYIVTFASTAMYRVNVVSNVATLITMSQPLSVADVGWHNGRLYGINAGNLVSINPTTGAVTVIGSSAPLNSAIAMWGFTNGLLATAGGAIYSIDPNNGAATLSSAAPASSNADGANCSAAAIQFDADLSVTKTNTPGSGPNDLPADTYTPGIRTYTIVVTNGSSSVGAQNVVVSDPVPAGIDPLTVSWTCTATSGGAQCGAASGSNALNDPGLDLPAGAVATYTVTMTVPPSFSGPLTNTVTITPPPAINDTNPANNTATDVDQAMPMLSLVKQVINDNGGGATTANFTLSATGPASISGISGAAAVTNARVPAGSYTLAETNVAGYTAAAWSCSGGTLTGSTLVLANAQTATCTIVNDDVAPQVTLVKTVADASGNGIAEPGEVLTYTITLSNTTATAFANYDFIENVPVGATLTSITGTGVTACALPRVGAATCNVSVASVPANGSRVITALFTVATPIPTGFTSLVNLVNGGDTTCGIAGNVCSVTTPTAAQLTLAKTAGTPTPTGVANQYTITYAVTATNAGGSTGSYSLTDTLSFNGATVTAISTPVQSSTTGDTQTGTLGSFVAPAGGTIVTGETLAAGGVETWTYTVTYTVTNAALAADCTVAGGGLRNRALLGGASAGAPAATTCSGAPNASIVKTAGTPVPTGSPNQFTLSYTVTISNSGTLPGNYNLSDTFTFNGATVNAVSTPLYSSVTDVRDGVLGTFTAPNGGVIVAGETISAGGAETWIYAVTYTVTNAATAQNCTIPGGGLRNEAALGGSLSGSSATCTGAPAVSIGKSASGPLPTGVLHQYELTYLVTVQNSGSVTGTYDLDDAFAFSGVSNVVASAVTHGGSDPLATTLGTLTATGGRIVTSETIAAGSSETYAYTVRFTLDNVAAVGSCLSSGGLVNTAALGGSSSGQVSTCSDVPDVIIAKSAGTPVPTAIPNQYTLAYTVTVSNAGDAAGTYNLADSFTFNGATVNAVSAVTHGGSDPLAATLGLLSPSGGSIVTAETIAANGSETYSYTVTFTLSNAALAGDCANLAGGLRNRAALGGSVDGEAATCTGTPSVTLVKALTGESGSQSGIAEPGETLTYTITLANGGGTAFTNYDFVENVPAGATLSSISGTGVTTSACALPLTGAATCNVTVASVPANASTTVTAVFTIANPIPAGITSIANLISGGDTNCGIAGNTCTVTTPTAGNVTLVKALASESGSQAGIAEPGEALGYTITLTNTGGTAVTAYGVTDRLDTNTTFVAASNGGTHAAGIVTWTGLTVPAQVGATPGTLVLTVSATVNSPIPAGVVQIANLAYQTGTTPPACPPASANCVVTPTAGSVTLVKALASETGGTQAGIAEPNETLGYTITLTNSGGTAVTAYGVTDRLDSNTTFVAASNGGTHAAGIVTWSGLTIPAQIGATPGSLVLTVSATVNSPIASGVVQIANLAYQTGTTPPACPPASANCVVTPTAGNVTLVKALASESGSQAGIAEPGETLGYTITLTNSGGTAVTAYGVTDRLDSNTTFVAASSGGTHAAGIVTWSGLTIPAQVGATPGSLVLTVSATVNSPIPAGVVQIANLAYQTGTTPPACPPASANCVVTPTAGSVTLVKALASETGGTQAGIAEPNETLGYTITLTNTGGTAVTAYGVTDRLDTNTTFVAASNGGTHAAGIVTWSGLTIPAQIGATPGTLVLTVSATVNSPIAPGVVQIANLAYQTGTTPPACPPAGPQCVVTPTSGQLSVSKALSGESITPDQVAQPGEELTYTITVRNAGGSAVSNVLVNERVPANTTFVSGTPTWSCAAGSPGGTTCDALVNIGAGSAGNPALVTLTFTVRVVDPLPTGVTRIGNVVALNDQPPVDCDANPTAPQCVQTPTVNLSLLKTVQSVAATGPGSYTVSYLIEVTNTGGSATTYTLTDTLGFASGVSFSGNGLVTTTGGTLSPTLAGGSFTPANGTVLQISATAVNLPAGTIHRYTVSVPVAVSAGGVSNGACTGSAGNGYYNAAALTGPIGLSTSACAPVAADDVRIRLVKTVLLGVDNNHNGYGDVGDVLGYTFVISNPGTQPLSAIQLIDPRVNDISCAATTSQGTVVSILRSDTIALRPFEGVGDLAAGDTMTCTATYTLTAADVASRRVVNVATTTGSGPSGQVATATGTAIFAQFR